MPSEIIPSLDLAPSVPSRVVSVAAADITKGTPLAGETVTFRLRGDLRVPADGTIISAGSVTLELDEDGQGRVRLPCYTTHTRADSTDGEWFIEVGKSWVSQRDLIRIPSGSSTIALAAIEPVREVPLHMAPSWLVTGAGVEIVQGAQWNATVTVTGGVARFVFTVPPAAVTTAVLGTSHLDEITQTGFFVQTKNADAITSRGYPVANAGFLEVTASGIFVLQRYTHYLNTRRYERTAYNGAWTAWRRIVTDDELTALTARVAALEAAG